MRGDHHNKKLWVEFNIVWRFNKKLGVVSNIVRYRNKKLRVGTSISLLCENNNNDNSDNDTRTVIAESPCTGRDTQQKGSNVPFVVCRH